MTKTQLQMHYYNAVVKKGAATYASWTGKTKSKRLVLTANEYVMDTRLKTDAVFRFYALAFAHALSLRIEKRYRDFLRKLFHLFAFLRERAALRSLRRALGWDECMDIREAIGIEFERIAVLLSLQEDDDTTGGGKHATLGDIELEQALQAFLEERTEEGVQKDGKPPLQSKSEALAETKELSSVNTQSTEREKISVDENSPTQTKQEKTVDKETKTQRVTKIETASEQTMENKPQEQTRSTANISILAEMAFVEQKTAEEEPSPFPVFRPEKTESSTPSIKEEGVKTNEQTERTLETAKEEGVEAIAPTETEKEQSPFPVFRNEKIEVVTAPEKPIEKPIEKPREAEAPIDELLEEPIERQFFRKEFIMTASEENKARMIMNLTMSKEQIDSIIAQKEAEAKMIMEQEENAWREQISVQENMRAEPLSQAVNTQSNNGVVQSIKK